MKRLVLFDAEARKRGNASFLLGVDEAGRGPLAGPVVVAAVALPEVPSAKLRGVRDSKLLKSADREKLYRTIRSEAIAISIAWAHPPAIDRDNILRATLLAMSRAARRAALKAPGSSVLALVDGPHRFPEFERQSAVVDGDAKSLSIAAASIVAKVVRDRWMERLERRYPGYGFARHKGYGTKTHAAALMSLGPCRAHRRSFKPVALAEAR